KVSNIIGKINIVMFSPEDLTLVKGIPSERRKFLDILISRIDRVHLYNLQEYNLALKQRNELLKRIKEKKKFKQEFDFDALSSWNSLLVKYGAEIIKKRFLIIPDLLELTKEKHRQLTSSKENIGLEYQSSLVKSSDEIDQIFDLFQEKLNKNNDVDIKLGTTTVGPHRDDLIITIDSMDIRKFGSQGQQRTAVLSLKLATIDLINQKLGDYPIILLDDVASELDEKRVSLLFDLINKIPAQTFLTTTDFHSNDMSIWLSNKEKTDLSIFIVENGSVREENAVYKGDT
ncbi:MAG: DNA replication/repair protein RecF, partial [Candidatus Poribacteria bacterium]